MEYPPLVDAGASLFLLRQSKVSPFRSPLITSHQGDQVSHFLWDCTAFLALVSHCNWLKMKKTEHIFKYFSLPPSFLFTIPLCETSGTHIRNTVFLMNGQHDTRTAGLLSPLFELLVNIKVLRLVISIQKISLLRVLRLFFAGGHAVGLLPV